MSLAFPSGLAPSIRAERLYNGVGRPFPVFVSGADRLKLLSASDGGASSLGEARLRGEANDLARLFPKLWSKDRPKGVLYLQAYRGAEGGGTPVGAALVLAPMTNPAVATLDATKAPKFEPDEDQAFAGYRAYLDAHVVIAAEGYGKMEFRMRPDAAPNTVANFLGLVANGFYDGTIVHRIVAKGRNGDPFVIQGGDPTGTGSGGPGYAIPLEDSSLPHDFGVISMARSTDPNTGGAQWFVALSRAGTARLDHKYASFGQLVRGADVLRRIAALPVGTEDRPFRPPVTSLRLVSAPPYPVEVGMDLPKGR